MKRISILKMCKKNFSMLTSLVLTLNIGTSNYMSVGATDQSKPEKKIALSSVELDPIRENLFPGDTTTLGILALNDDKKTCEKSADIPKLTKYSSNSETCVSVSHTGVITAKKAGVATIKAEVTVSGVTKSGTTTITVIDPKNIKSYKTCATIFTSAKVLVARDNIKKYDWAASVAKTAIDQADKYVSLGNDFLWNMVTAQTLPRSFAVSLTNGSIELGKAFNDKYGVYGWKCDPVNHPWKLINPDNGLMYPTNDFGAYYKSGLDKHGLFHQELADKSLLKNTLYPEKGEKWGVDDGTGYVDEKGNKFTFIAYYVHWGLWYDQGSKTTPGLILNALKSLKDAYVYTGNAKYAEAGMVLLDRIADVYPEFDCAAYKWDDGFVNSHGGTYQGKVLGSIWEPLMVTQWIYAYDAFYPAMNDAKIIDFLKNKATQYNLSNPKNTASAIKRNIEDNILKQILPSAKRGKLEGNFGMSQSTLAAAAVVLDTMPYTKDMLDFMFQTKDAVTYDDGTASSVRTLSGGDVSRTLVNTDLINRDGQGNEGSPDYNALWVNQLKMIADVLEGYDKYPTADLYANPKFEKMLTGMYPLTLIEKYVANVGDTGGCGKPQILVSTANCVKAFEKYGDPLYAQLAYFSNGNTANGLHTGILTKEPEKIVSRIKAAIEKYGYLNLPSQNLTDAGFGILRDGVNKNVGTKTGFESNTLRDIWVYYGTNINHGHKGSLALGIHAFGLDLAPDNGYPEQTGMYAPRMAWDQNTISHNTVVVDKAKQGDEIVGQPYHFDSTDFVKLMDVESKVYSQTSQYRRTTAMIKVDDTNSYTVDFFRVKGGNDHYYSFHSYEGDVTTQGLELVSQSTGTYAGPNVAYQSDYDGKTADWSYMGSGFQYLKNVQSDNNPSQNFSVQWNIKDLDGKHNLPDDVHLKMTMLNSVHDIAICDGVPPQGPSGNPTNLKYFVAHRSGKNLNSLFTTIFEPYKNNSYIKTMSESKVTRADGIAIDADVKAVKVILNNGRIDYIVNAINKDTTYIIDNKFKFKGFFGVYSLKNEKVVHAYLNDGSLLDSYAQTPSVSGVISNFTQDFTKSNQITVTFAKDSAIPKDLTGRFIYIDNDGTRSTAYEIKGIKNITGNVVTLDVGNTTTIQGYVDDHDFRKGYQYTMKVGAKFSIPLSTEWSH